MSATGFRIRAIIAKRLVQLYSGKLEIDSVPGKGTQVCVHLPAGKRAYWCGQ